jgi:hypothetical protein
MRWAHLGQRGGVGAGLVAHLSHMNRTRFLTHRLEVARFQDCQRLQRRAAVLINRLKPTSARARGAVSN